MLFSLRLILDVGFRIEMIGIIFDLDGTLIDSYDLDERLYRKAVLLEVPGVKFRKSWYEYRYSTDSGILTEILKEFDLPIGHYYDLVRQRFGKLVKEHLQSSNNCRPIPGAPALLAKLRKTPNIEIGIATGGWLHTARMKLKAAGLSHLKVPTSSGDDAHSRTEIMQICASKMGSSISDFIYVGDGEWDLKAADELGWKFIGVGKRIMGKCDIWVPDLSDAELFLTLSCT
jgi:phosphoglycolate phosphatase-like HAD superfamily hydrolase